MIELLVAVLVMGIGVLGITGLQMVESAEQPRRARARRGGAARVRHVSTGCAPIPARPTAASLNLAAPPAVATELSCGRLHARRKWRRSTRPLWKCSLGNVERERVLCRDLRDGVTAPARGAINLGCRAAMARSASQCARTAS